MPVLAFAFGLALLTGVLFGVAPAWISSQTDPVDALRTGARTAGSEASFLQRALVVLQVIASEWALRLENPIPGRRRWPPDALPPPRAPH